MDQLPAQMIIVHKILIFFHHRSLNPILPLRILIILSLHFADALIILALLTLFHQFSCEILKFGEKADLDGINFDVVVEVDVAFIVHVYFVDGFVVHFRLLILIVKRNYSYTI